MARIDTYMVNSEFESRDRTFDTRRIYLAEIMDTRNVSRAGELKIWRLNSSVNKNDSSKWETAYYCSKSFGTTPYNKTSKNTFENSPKSFGEWLPIPCVGNLVFVFYACTYGENVQAYWFGCPVDTDLNFMIPGIPSAFENDKGTLCEYNNKNFYDSLSSQSTTQNSNNTYDNRLLTESQREDLQAEYKPINNALKRQGLDKDKLRGISTSGAKRESPSMCYGYLTPFGQSFVIDDGWEESDNKETWNNTTPDILAEQERFSVENCYRYNAGFRFRTRNGTQVLISDDGNIYAINNDGSAWFELTDDGRIQGYSKNSADIACDGDINFKAKKIIMEADDGFAFKSRNGGISFDVKDTVNLKTPKIVTDNKIYADTIETKTANFENLSAKNSQLNGVFKGTLSGTAFYATNAGETSVPQPEPQINDIDIPDVVVEEDKEIVGRNGEKQNLINTVAPTAEPYDGHNRNNKFPKLDVNVKIPKENKKSNYNSGVTNQIIK